MGNPISQRHLVVLAPLAGLFVVFWVLVGGAWGPRFRSVDTWVASVLIIVLVGFLWARPSLLLYVLGSVAALVALGGFWLGSPVGSVWVHGPPHFPPPLSGPQGEASALVYGVLFPAAFPIAWMLLAASVRRFQIGALIFCVVGVVLLPFGLPYALSGDSVVAVVAMTVQWFFIWPHSALLVLGLVGLFGRTFG